MTGRQRHKKSTNRKIGGKTKRKAAQEMRYWVILKKVSFCIFRIILVSKVEKNFTIESKDKDLSEQVFMIFGRCQNNQN